MHPTGKIFISASEDRTWALYDVDTAECMLQVHAPLFSSPPTNINPLKHLACNII
jgi:hypothetical protein